MAKEVQENIKGILRFIGLMSSRIENDLLDFESFERRGDGLVALIKVKKESGDLRFKEHKQLLELASNDYKSSKTQSVNKSTIFDINQMDRVGEKIEHVTKEMEMIEQDPAYKFERKILDISEKNKYKIRSKETATERIKQPSLATIMEEDAEIFTNSQNQPYSAGR
jgi:hypothetical protein